MGQFPRFNDSITTQPSGRNPIEDNLALQRLKALGMGKMGRSPAVPDVAGAEPVNLPDNAGDNETRPDQDGPQPGMTRMFQNSASIPQISGMPRPSVNPNVLAGLRQGANEAQNLVGQRLSQESVLDDATRNLENNWNTAQPAAPGMGEGHGTIAMSGATPAGIQQLRSSLNESPQFGVQQQQMMQERQGANETASQAGFGSPQEAAGYQRGQEQLKTMMPLSVENARGQFGLQQTNATQQGENYRQQKGFDNGKESFDALKQLVAPNGQMAMGAGFSAPGMGEVHQGYPTAAANALNAGAPSAILNRVTDAMQKYQEASKHGGGWVNAANPAADSAKAVLEQTVQNELAKHPGFQHDPASPNIKAHVATILSDPKYFSMPIDELLTPDPGMTPLSPEDEADLRRLLIMVRGH